MSARFIVVTAADDYYMPLALDFLRSVRRLKTSFAFDIGLLDVGLSEPSKQQLAPFGVTIKPAKIDIDYPGREAWERQAPSFRTLTARPYLPDYFPGYAAIMWMDADSWAQTGDAIETMLPAAASGEAIHMAMELDRDYPVLRQGRTLWQLHEKWYRANFPAYLAEEMLLRPMLNCGIWAAAPTAPVWKKWAKVYAHTLQRIAEMQPANFMTDQLGMNVAAYLDAAPFATIPVRIQLDDFVWPAEPGMPRAGFTCGHPFRIRQSRFCTSIIRAN